MFVPQEKEKVKEGLTREEEQRCAEVPTQALLKIEQKSRKKNLFPGGEKEGKEDASH